MDTTCKNCRFWAKPNAHKGGIGKRECDGLDVSTPRNKTDNDATIEVYADDDQGLTAVFMTGPDFGCTLFKPKN